MADDKIPPDPADHERAAGPAYAQVREQAQGLLAEGRQEEAIAFLLAALAAVLRKSRELELLLMKLRRAQAGKTSERINPEQLLLLLEELFEQAAPEAVDREAEARADAELTREIEQAEEASGEQREKQRPRRQTWQTRGVEREVHVLDVTAAERICPICGAEQQAIGADTSRVLEYVPAHFVEHEYHRQKYACGTCKRGVTTAPAPPRVIERGAAGASLLAHVVVSKYADHCPLTRLSRIYARSGADIPVSTLSDWVGAVADRLEPVADVLARRVLQATVAATDATGLKVLDPQSPENIVRGTMWCYVGDHRDVVFRYTPTGEGASGPWEFLAGRHGYIQADAANVFDRVYNGRVASAIEVGCWAHGRRRLVALQETDCRAAYPVQLIARLYRIEHLADAKGLSTDERAALRRERSQPVLDKLQRYLASLLAKEPPSSELASAARYVMNQWKPLNRFVEDGRLDLDNNVCEQQIRDVALGRRNYLFAGSHRAARRAAVLYSLMRTSAQHGVAPLPYLTDVLQKLATGWPVNRLEELLPDRWQTLHSPGNGPGG